MVAIGRCSNGPVLCYKSSEILSAVDVYWSVGRTRAFFYTTIEDPRVPRVSISQSTLIHSSWWRQCAITLFANHHKSQGEEEECLYIPSKMFCIVLGIRGCGMT